MHPAWLTAAAVVIILLVLCRRTRPREFSKEYRARLRRRDWQVLRRACFSWTFGRDCILPWLPATDLDHLQYRNLGHERLGADVVPLNWRTHRVVTRARQIFGRPIVNLILRCALGLWLTPYVAVGVMGAIVFFPQQAHAAWYQVTHLRLR